MTFLNIFRLRYITLFTLLFCVKTMAQTIEVKDAATNVPIEGVAIYDATKKTSVLTNAEGQASLENFDPSATIFIQFLGFKEQKINLKDQKQNTISIALEAQEEVLDEIILSIARSESTRQKIAEKVTVIRAKDIAFQAPATGADLLEMSPGVRIQKSQGGGGSPILRGFEANRVLLVVDGVRMNNAIYRSGHLQNALTVDPHNIERVEVVFGSSSVGYGSDALGGVIHYYTKSPEINGVEKIKNSFSSEFNSANTASVNNISTDLSFKNWGSRTSFSFSNFGDIRIGKNRRHGFDNWGLTPFFSENTRNIYTPNQTPNEDPLIQKNTGYQQYDLFQKFVVKLPQEKQLTLNFQLSNSSDIPRYDKLVELREENLRFAEWFYGPQFRLLIAPSLKFYSGKKLLKKGEITLAYQKIKESRISRLFNSLDRISQKETVHVFSLNGDFDANFTGKYSLSYGFEGTYNKVNSLAFKEELLLEGNKIVDYDYPLSIPSRYPSAGSSYTSFAGYANWVFDLNESFTLNAGLRLTHTILEANWKETYNVNALLSSTGLNTTALTQTVALTYRTKNNVQWSTMVSSGFRNPNIDDIGKIRESKGILVVPNQYLKPEYAYNYEVGVSKYSENRENYFSLRTFASLISRHILRTDFIVHADESTENLNTIMYNGEEVLTVSNKNLGNRFLYGGSIDGKAQLLKNLQARGSVTYTKSDNNLKYGPLPSISPVFGDFNLNYNKERFSANAVLRFSGSKDPNEYSWGGEDGLEETPRQPVSQTSEFAPNGTENYLFHSDSNDVDFYYAGSPAWTDISIQTQYLFDENIQLRLGINNIFDQHYRTFASGISAPGRSFRLGLHVDF